MGFRATLNFRKFKVALNPKFAGVLETQGIQVIVFPKTIVAMKKTMRRKL